MTLNRGHVISAIEQYLRSIQVIKDAEDIRTIELSWDQTGEHIPTKIYFNKSRGIAQIQDG
jgi:hypothetical protein